MVFTFKNLGPIKEATLEVGDLTLLCGQNNTGKTYLTYGVCGFLKNNRTLIDDIFSDSENIVLHTKREEFYKEGKVIFSKEELRTLLKNDIVDEYKKQLSFIFSANQDHFKNTEISVDINYLYFEKYHENKANFQFIGGEKNEVTYGFIEKEDSLTLELEKLISDSKGASDILALFSTFLLKRNMPAIFILPAERTNIRLFLNEIDKSRSDFVVELLNKEVDVKDIKKSLNDDISRFAQPIQENLDFARNLPQIVKYNSFLEKEHPELITYIEEMLGIQYIVRDGQLLVMDMASEYVLPYYMASTSVRTLADLYLWLKHLARPNSILFIDEPELNIHPENQIKLARLFAKLVNIGIKVFITTHSEYIVKEFNNLITLSNDFKGKADFMERHGYTEQDMLKPKQIKSYIAEKGTLTAVPVDNFGLLYTTFDDSIQQINKVAGEMAFFIEESETTAE